MQFPSSLPKRAACAFALTAAAALPAYADLCTLTTKGQPILTTVNPKPFQVPPPTTCLVDGLPGQSQYLQGYILFAERTAPIVINGVTVGTFYDRAYCKGHGSKCAASDTVLLATRVQMLPGEGGAKCPKWSGATSDCFEINDVFRTDRTGTKTQVGYWMGVDGDDSGNPDTEGAIKYLEYTGHTFVGLNQGPITRDNAKTDFRTDINIFDPDGVNAPWSPWLFEIQKCPNGVVTTNLTTNPVTRFAVRFREGGEEGQIQTSIDTAGYACNQ